MEKHAPVTLDAPSFVDYQQVSPEAERVPEPPHSKMRLLRRLGHDRHGRRHLRGALVSCKVLAGSERGVDFRLYREKGGIMGASGREGPTQVPQTEPIILIYPASMTTAAMKESSEALDGESRSALPGELRRFFERGPFSLLVKGCCRDGQVYSRSGHHARTGSEGEFPVRLHEGAP